MSKYCLVVNGPGYFPPFDHLGLEKCTNPKILDENPSSVGLVVFTGGSDVSPSLYGHKNTKSYTNPSRDDEEVSIFHAAVQHDIPMAGICRGAQFLCAMAGGTLVQDITNHTEYHRLMYLDENGATKESPESVTSTHHQMQHPWSLPKGDFEILAWSSVSRSSHYIYDGYTFNGELASRELKTEPDVVYYPRIKALGIQYHPEWMARDSWGFKYAQKVVSEKLGMFIGDNLNV